MSYFCWLALTVASRKLGHQCGQFAHFWTRDKQLVNFDEMWEIKKIISIFKRQKDNSSPILLQNSIIFRAPLQKAKFKDKISPPN